MHLTLSYFGGEQPFHYRRDFILLLYHGLRAAGHQVELAWHSLNPHSHNFIIAGYSLSAAAVRDLIASGYRYAVIETELITGTMLNRNPHKTDFSGAYIPLLQHASWVWDGYHANVAVMRDYGANAHVLPMGAVPELHEIKPQPPQFDAYFFGGLSPYRRAILQALQQAGYAVAAHDYCPYFLRNDYLRRARWVLNLRHDATQNHATLHRLWYLYNNRLPVLTQAQDNSEGWLDYATVSEDLAAAMAAPPTPLRQADSWPLFSDQLKILLDHSVAG